MTINELKKELETIEYRKFCHECKDRWDSRDYEINRQYAEQIRNLKKQIEALS